MNVLGISAFYHDSAACLVRDGEILAAAQEERFSRKKHDAAFPHGAIAYCLQESGLARASALDLVAFYEKPFLKFDRLLSTYLACAPNGLPSFLKAMPVWMKEKIWLKARIREELDYDGPVLFPEHHESHAASAFFPSPFEQAAVVTIDGVGEWTTTSIGRGQGNKVELTDEMQFPHSLGLLYSAFTYYLGFRVNSGEYKVMGLAPYGEPKFRDLILSELIDLKPDGSFRLNLRYFNFMTGLTMTNRAFDNLLGGPRRKPEAELTPRHLDIARSIQAVTEEVMLRLARHAHTLTGERNLCLAGGVALNCVGNGRILREGPFEKIWIQPAAGDAGGALGAALIGWHHFHDKPRTPAPDHDSQHASLVGPAFEAVDFLRREAIPYTELSDEQLVSRVAGLLEEGNVIGWFQGRMEFGPRALGNRSILADPRRTDMQTKLNLKIKFRESFRPFAPAVLEERAADCFDLATPSPYMLLVAPVGEALRVDTESDSPCGVMARLKERRSTLPAITHVDYSARIQTVALRDNAPFHGLLSAFERRTGCPVLVNTSFNVRGEPPVCTPEDAYRCFVKTEMDYLVLGNLLVEKAAIAEKASRSGGFQTAAGTQKPSGRPPLLEASTPSALRRFGLTIGLAFLFLGGVLLFRQRPAGWPLTSIAVLLLLAAVIAPRALQVLYRPWMRAAEILGAITSRILLTLVFFLVVTPIGLVQRLIGKRQLQFDFRNEAKTNWQKCRPVGTTDYERQF
ncbi:MAG TPA: SxtJ family membrane protein [Chthoniobacterales bacterium]|nr:SxtJ family membrane protein [Chthoniobacterales bacterium]